MRRTQYPALVRTQVRTKAPGLDRPNIMGLMLCMGICFIYGLLIGFIVGKVFF